MQKSDLTGPPLRIVSLIPSGTDLVAALGLAEWLVGVSHECDHPAATGLPVLTSSVIPPPTVDGPVMSAIEIDTIVSTSISQGESLYKTDRALLKQLAPDVVLTQDVCDVCAVNVETARSAMCDLPDGAQLVMLTATSVEGMYTDLLVVGEALGVADRAAQLVSDMRASFNNQGEEATKHRPGAKRVSMLALEWSDPPFLGGHWVPELVALAGADHVLSGPGEASRRSTWEEIAHADPDVIVFCPCGYDLHQATLEATSLLLLPAVASLRAVRSGRFFAVDANRLFSRCTTNLVEATELLRALTDLEVGTLPPAGANRISSANMTS
jgi:iron complex transport system substrate-binding protein